MKSSCAGLLCASWKACKQSKYEEVERVSVVSTYVDITPRMVMRMEEAQNKPRGNKIVLDLSNNPVRETLLVAVLSAENADASEVNGQSPKNELKGDEGASIP